MAHSQRQFRAERDKFLRQQLAFLGPLCESHKGEKLQETLSMIIAHARELKRDGRMNKKRREALQTILQECGAGQPGTVELDGNRMYVADEFDVDSLALRITW